jgi:hypothetical protein
MEAMAQFAVLAVATVMAMVAALGLNWFFLRAAFYLMQPAAVRPARAVHADLVHGVRAAARQFALHQ